MDSIHGLFTVQNNSDVQSCRILYTPSAFARTSLLYLQETGTLQAKKAHVNRRNKLNSYLFFVVISGCGQLCYNGKKYDLSAGDCVFIDCHKDYYHRTGFPYTATQGLWKLKWIHFYGTDMNAIFEKYGERGGQPVFSSENVQNYIQLLDRMYIVADSDSYVRDMEIHAELSRLLVLLMKDAWPKKSEPVLERAAASLDVQLVKKYLDQHYVEKITLDQLASVFFVNKFYLIKRFKECYGTTINNYIISKRITKAKQLLRFGKDIAGKELTLEAISSACGFSSAAYLSRAFKKVECISPSEYRKRW